jgi:hypothetical protein
MILVSGQWSVVSGSLRGLTRPVRKDSALKEEAANDGVRELAPAPAAR